jgi:ActR/RegA family two-component response regulator
LGSNTFVEKIRPRLETTETVTEVPKRQRRLHRPALQQFLAKRGTRTARDQAIAKAYLQHGYTLSEIGRAVDLHYATVSRIVKAREEM